MKNITSASLLDLVGQCQDALAQITEANSETEMVAIARKALGQVTPVVSKINKDRIEQNTVRLPRKDAKFLNNYDVQPGM